MCSYGSRAAVGRGADNSIWRRRNRHKPRFPIAAIWGDDPDRLGCARLGYGFGGTSSRSRSSSGRGGRVPAGSVSRPVRGGGGRVRRARRGRGRQRHATGSVRAWRIRLGDSHSSRPGNRERLLSDALERPRVRRGASRADERRQACEDEQRQAGEDECREAQERAQKEIRDPRDTRSPGRNDRHRPRVPVAQRRYGGRQETRRHKTRRTEGERPVQGLRKPRTADGRTFRR